MEIGGLRVRPVNTKHLFNIYMLWKWFVFAGGLRLRKRDHMACLCYKAHGFRSVNNPRYPYRTSACVIGPAGEDHSQTIYAFSTGIRAQGLTFSRNFASPRGVFPGQKRTPPPPRLTREVNRLGHCGANTVGRRAGVWPTAEAGHTTSHIREASESSQWVSSFTVQVSSAKCPDKLRCRPWAG